MMVQFSDSWPTGLAIGSLVPSLPKRESCLRLYNDYGGYTMDITGPLMILTQKLSSLALALHDGHLAKRGRSGGSESRWCHRVDELPSVLDYLAYSYYLPTLMAGPHVVSDTFRPAQSASSNSIRQRCHSSWSRCKYYFAWSWRRRPVWAHGFGFSGTDPSTGKPRYDLAKSFFFKDVEFGTSIRAVVAGWNVSTARWLRELVYERSPGRSRHPCSDLRPVRLWHGFYPGYYWLLCHTSPCSPSRPDVSERFLVGYVLWPGNMTVALWLLLCLPSSQAVPSDLMCFAQKYIVPYSCCLCCLVANLSCATRTPDR
uniref:Secreted protein n=1 Tax=Macrostomum lignano TaxID=282301 RepID=A0A1I8JRG9_9PLAT